MAARGASGIVGALIFNVSLIALPFGAVETWRAWAGGEIYTYAVTPQSQAATKAALDREAAKLTAAEADRDTAWTNLVAREIGERDFRSAHGALLAAPEMLSSASANKLQTRLPPNASDDQITAAAMALLPPEISQGYEAPLAAGDFLVLGDMRDLTLEAERWLQGQKIDELTLILTGLSVAPSENARDAAGGASVVKLARRTGKLSPPITRYFEGLVFAAAPPERLKPALQKALASAQLGTEESAVAQAFQSSIDPEGYKHLAADLSEIRALSKATGADVAARLLELAKDSADIRRLRLIGAAGGDRAALIAKLGNHADLLGTAKGAWSLTLRAWQGIGALVFAIAGLLFSTLVVMGQTLTGKWRDDSDLLPPPDPNQAIGREEDAIPRTG